MIGLFLINKNKAKKSFHESKNLNNFFFKFFETRYKVDFAILEVFHYAYKVVRGFIMELLFDFINVYILFLLSLLFDLFHLVF